MADRVVIEPPGNVPIMVVAAHPDDMESWCAGTLARSIDSGATVRLLLVTSGDKGSSDPGITSAQVGAEREREAQEAARRLGITEVRFLRYPDGDVEDTRDFRAKLVEWIRRWRPAVLFTHDPEHPYPPYITHRDHRIVGRATLDAVYPLARDRLVFPEQEEAGLLPHKVSQVWLFSSDQPNAYVDISAGFDKKISARLAHRSQTPDPAALAASWRERAERIGGEAGLPLGEAFTILYLD
ncbi:MAG: PIG-L family deacetylase [Chloroflexota bacterium]|nr:PIG-L family deacetylase [Chloroflexota bacterium]